MSYENISSPISSAVKPDIPGEINPKLSAMGAALTNHLERIDTVEETISAMGESITALGENTGGGSSGSNLGARVIWTGILSSNTLQVTELVDLPSSTALDYKLILGGVEQTPAVDFTVNSETSTLTVMGDAIGTDLPFTLIYG